MQTVKPVEVHIDIRIAAELHPADAAFNNIA